jgi:hypothetical protein
MVSRSLVLPDMVLPPSGFGFTIHNNVIRWETSGTSAGGIG